VARLVCEGCFRRIRRGLRCGRCPAPPRWVPPRVRVVGLTAHGNVKCVVTARTADAALGWVQRARRSGTRYFVDLNQAPATTREVRRW